MHAALIVDGQNFYHACLDLGIDFKADTFVYLLESELQTRFGESVALERRIWVSPAPRGPGGVGLARFLGAMDRAGFEVRLTEPGTRTDDAAVQEAVAEMVDMDVVVVVSGDGHMLDCLLAAREEGLRTVVVTTFRGTNYFASAALKFVADTVDLADLYHKYASPHGHMAPSARVPSVA